MTSEIPNAGQRGYEWGKDPFLWLSGLFAIALVGAFLQGLWGDINWQAAWGFTMLTLAAQQASAARRNRGVEGRQGLVRYAVFSAVLCLCAGLMLLMFVF